MMEIGLFGFFVVSVLIIGAPRSVIAIFCLIKSGGTDVAMIGLGVIASVFGGPWLDSKIRNLIKLAFHAITGRQLVVEKVVEREKPVEKIVYRDRIVRETVAVRHMTTDEAFLCLGLERHNDVDPNKVKIAYRSMMQKIHPDHGGSKYLAQLVNDAKKMLVG